ncbi:MAG: hypothetical protein ABH805_02380 [Candidatus Nealsonbacteria bacterium]
MAISRSQIAWKEQEWIKKKSKKEEIKEQELIPEVKEETSQSAYVQNK